MEPILLYGVPLGSATGLITAFEWLGKPYKLCRVDMLNGEMQAQDYKKINARHETPALITPEKQPLTENMAIALWMEARDSEKRISFDSHTREADLMHQFMAFTNSSFSDAFTPLWYVLEMEHADPALQEQAKKLGSMLVTKRHQQLEEMLQDTPYLIGDHPTLADALLVGIARWMDFHKVGDREEWPKLSAWRNRVEATPAFQFAQAIENGETPSGSSAFRGHVSLSEIKKMF